MALLTQPQTTKLPQPTCVEQGATITITALRGADGGFRVQRDLICKVGQMRIEAGVGASPFPPRFCCIGQGIQTDNFLVTVSPALVETNGNLGVLCSHCRETAMGLCLNYGI